MITIGQLARYAGVSIKTVRVYHAKGLLAEPERDSSGYRRYTAGHAIDLLKIRTLADAGVPLARIRILKKDNYLGLPQAVHEIDAELAGRIRALRFTQCRLRELADSDAALLPPEVTRHVQSMQRIGFSERWIDLQANLWILVYATHPEVASALLQDQEPAYSDPVLGQIFLDYDRAFDLSADDPRSAPSPTGSLRPPAPATTRTNYPAKTPTRTSPH